MKLWPRSFTLLLLSALLLSACGPRSRAADLPPAATSLDERVVQASTRFGYGLFEALRAEAPVENIFISPVSVTILLSLLYNGAGGETQAAMAEALQLQGLTADELNQAHAALQTILANPDPRVKISVANSVWYKQEKQVRPAFAEIAARDYGAAVQPLDFSSSKAVPTMNRWVEKQTDGKIKGIVDRLKPEDRMVLLNAIYFQGAWKYPFDSARNQPFHRQDGTAKQHPLMTSKEERFLYYEADGLQAVRLPYGEERVSMYVVLPPAEMGLHGWLTSLDGDGLHDLLGQLAPSKGTVTMPKVKLEYGANLKEALSSLGMGIAFDPDRADFGGLFADPEPIYIDRGIQKTFLEINEKGTTAIAVTKFSMGMGSSAPPPKPFVMTVDRPYFLAIRDDRTDVILFMGAIVDP